MIKIVFVVLSAFFGVAQAAPAYPSLFMSYSGIFDQVCAQRSGYEIKSEWVREAVSRRPEFQAAWDKAAPDLVGTMIRTVGRGFKRKEMTVTLSVCNHVPISNPFLLNLRHFLESTSGERDPAPMSGFVDVVFHELIHNYLVGNFDVRKSAFMKEYRDESPSVLSHLHLMALQNSVYLKLNRPEMLKWLDTHYTKHIGGDYARAWMIVNELRGYEPFVEELKGL